MGPISFEQPSAVITGRSLRMSEQYAGNASYGLNLVDMVVADLNGDALDDVAALGYGWRDTALGPTVAPEQRDAWLMVTRADGFGGFEAGTVYPLDSFDQLTLSVGGLDIGDVDNDGDNDIVIGLNAELTVLAMLNDGTGLFPQEERTPVAQRPDGTLLLAELTGDSFVDVAATSRHGGRTMILRGNGDGSFAPETDLVAPNPETVTTIDLDGDGETHLVTNRYSYNESAYLQLWSRDAVAETWSPITLQAPQPDNAAVVSNLYAPTAWVGDVDGDGDEDLVAAGSSNNAVGAAKACVAWYITCARVLLNDGAGNLVGQPETYPIETGFYLTANFSIDLNNRGDMYDLDGDGNLDVIAPGRHGSVNVIFGDGAGGFGEPVAWNVLANITPTGGWTQGEDRGASQTTIAVAVADTTGDGRGDIVAATNASGELGIGGNNHGAVAVATSIGDRDFASASVTAGPPDNDWIRQSNKQFTHLVDWNGDGRDDVVVLGSFADPATPAVGAKTPSLLMRPGLLGGFGPPERIGDIPLNCLEGATLAGSAIGDIDGDGSLDVACGDSRLYVVFGDGAGGLDPAVDLGFVDGSGIFTDTHELAIVDLDDDGLDDVVYVTRRQETVSGVPEQLSGNLIIGWSRQTTAPGGDPVMEAVAIAHEQLPATAADAGTWSSARPVIDDVTGDGKVDVVIHSSRAVDRLLVFRNESTPGAPSFVRTPQNDAFTGNPDVVATLSYNMLSGLDVDGDGDIDIVANHRPNSGFYGPQRWINVLLRNDGTGTFTAEALLAGNGQANPVAVDVDNDGNVDLAFPTSIRGVEVWRGRDDGSLAQPATFPVADRAVNWLAFTDVDDDGFVDIVAAREPGVNNPALYPSLVVARNTSTGLEGPADLVVTEVDVSTTPNAADIEVTVANSGGSVIDDDFTTTLWLSVDDTWGLDDVLLGEVTHTDRLVPAGTSTATLTTALVPLVGGDQYVVARTDPRRQVAESDENNNTGSTLVTLAVPQLTVGGAARTVTPSATAPGVVRVAASAVPVRVAVEGGASTVSSGGPDRVPTATSASVQLTGPGTLVLPAHSGDSYLPRRRRRERHVARHRAAVRCRPGVAARGGSNR